jgi:protein gp37
MSANTKIEWPDHTFNPWIGCTKVGPGCDNCYAKAEWDNRRHRAVWGAGQARSRTKTWGDPVRWNKQADAFLAEHGRRQRVFCASLADVFDNEVSREWRADLFTLIANTPNLDWLLLTKRIGNAQPMIAEAMRDQGDADSEFAGWPWPNVWLGATIVSQAEADRDIPKLLNVPAAKRFLSMEPLLGPVDLTRIDINGDFEIYPLRGTTECVNDEGEPAQDFPAIDWVIVGGESGPSARPMHPDWARSLRDQCQAAGVAFLFKQWGNWRPAAWFDGPDADNDYGDDFVDVDRTPHQFLASDGRTWDTMGGQLMYPPMPLGHWCLMVNEGKKAAGRLLDGREWNGVPA